MMQGQLLGGSWVVISSYKMITLIASSRGQSRMTTLIASSRGHITLLISSLVVPFGDYLIGF